MDQVPDYKKYDRRQFDHRTSHIVRNWFKKRAITKYIQAHIRGNRPTVKELSKFVEQERYHRRVPLLILIFGLGMFTFGLTFHIYEIEPHWTRRYGVELPISPYRISRFYYKFRSRYEDMTYYRINYYNPEQNIDPLSDDIMDPAQFQMYKGKRVLRFERYMRKRDRSFDFMIIGEHPWQLVDDDL